MAQASDGEACFGECHLALPADGKERKGAGQGEELFRIREADSEFFIRRCAVREEISFFIRMERKDVPQEKFIGGKAGFEACAPDDGVGGLIEAFLFLSSLRDEGAVHPAGARAFTAEDHPARDFGMLVQEHTLAGHGDAGEVSALIAAGFGDEKDLCPPDAPGEVVRKLFLADGDGAADFVVCVCITPWIEDVLALVGGERSEEMGEIVVHDEPFK